MRAREPGVLGALRVREQLAHGVPGLGVGGGVAARGAPERRLIDEDHLAHRLGTQNLAVLAWHLDVDRAEPARERVVYHVDTQRALARAARAADRAQHAERD